MRQAHSALQDGQRVCRSFGMRISLERQGKRSEDWVTASDAVKARFHSFKTLGMYRRPPRPCNLMLRRVREVADRLRHRAILDRGPEGRRALALTKVLTGLERARCACRAEVQPLLGEVSCNRAEPRTTQRLVCRS